MKKLLPLLLLATSFASAIAQNTIIYKTLQGISRRFIVHVPSSYVVGQSLPMVINMHGHGSNDAQQEFYSKMDGVADANKFIVVYPNGVDSAWRVGWVAAPDSAYDDVAFINFVIDTMITAYGIDTNRVYACGMSNGGFMSQKLACELSNRIAAIASVSGTFSDSLSNSCHPNRKIPVMMIHGTNDPVVPYNGSSFSTPVEATITKWLGFDSCTATSDTILYTNTNTTDSCTVQRIDYRTCGDSTEFLFLKVINGGHTWPGALIDIASFGNTNHDIDASTEIWNFFNRYTLHGPRRLLGINDASTGILVIKAYPNPVNGQLTVEAPETIQTITVSNVLGQQVICMNVNAIKYTTDLSHLTNGFYLLRLAGNGWATTQQLVKE